jgi:hypothetical protein
MLASLIPSATYLPKPRPIEALFPVPHCDDAPPFRPYSV